MIGSLYTRRILYLSPTGRNHLTIALLQILAEYVYVSSVYQLKVFFVECAFIPSLLPTLLLRNFYRNLNWREYVREYEDDYFAGRVSYFTFRHESRKCGTIHRALPSFANWFYVKRIVIKLWAESTCKIWSVYFLRNFCKLTRLHSENYCTKNAKSVNLNARN